MVSEKFISNSPSCVGSAGLDSLRQMVLSREHQQDVGIARISREDSGVWKFRWSRPKNIMAALCGCIQ